MNQYHGNKATVKARAIAPWQNLLNDKAALLKNPGAHHRALLSQANALHRAGKVDDEDLADLLEQADGALAYAVEALLDSHGEE
jgi:hypothetical protein